MERMVLLNMVVVVVLTVVVVVVVVRGVAAEMGLQSRLATNDLSIVFYIVCCLCCTR
jgi:hypothetical protein